MLQKNKKLVFFLGGSLILLMSGCAVTKYPDTLVMNDLNLTSQIQTVHILNIRKVEIKNTTGTKGQATLGAVIGGGFGAVAGDNREATMIGAGIGGLVGAATGAFHKNEGVRLKFRDTDGNIKLFAEMANPQWFKVGKADKITTYHPNHQKTVVIDYNNKPVTVAKK